MLLEQVRPTKAVEHDQVMSGPCRNLRRGACRFLEVRNVIDSDGDAVLFSPVLREAIEPGIELGNEVTPLNYPQRYGVGKDGRHERCRRQAGGGWTGARGLQEVPSRDGTLLVSSVSHRTTPVCYEGCSVPPFEGSWLCGAVRSAESRGCAAPDLSTEPPHSPPTPTEAQDG